MLKDLLADGTIWIERGCYLGQAVDCGEVVCIGSIGDEENVELYLAEHPTPYTW
jgi:hypothetical protein